MHLALAQGDLDKLSRIMEEYPGTTVAYWAAAAAADYRLMRGCNLLFVDKALAQQELNKAVELYSDLERGRVPELVERAKFGLARAKEAKRELEEAVEYYEDLAQNAKTAALAAAARERLAELNRPEIKRVYDDFRQFDPKPVAPTGAQPRGDLPASGLDQVSGEEPPVIPRFGEMKLDDEKTTPEENAAAPVKEAEPSDSRNNETAASKEAERQPPETPSQPTGDEGK